MNERPPDVPGEPELPDTLLLLAVIAALLLDLRPLVDGRRNGPDPELLLRLTAVRSVVMRLREHLEAQQ